MHFIKNHITLLQLNAEDFLKITKKIQDYQENRVQQFEYKDVHFSRLLTAYGI